MSLAIAHSFDDHDTLIDEDPEVRTAPARPKHARARLPIPPGRFELGPLLGSGGMGEVRLAHDPRIGRDVAVKLMRGACDAGAVTRFLREARVQGRLDHPAIVPVYELDVDERGAPYFAMKRLTGTTLLDVLEARAAGDPDVLARWSQRRLLARLIDICLAIEFAHGRGVIHRDLKPANIMLGDFGEAYVLDWGIARIVDADDDRRISRAGLDSRDGSLRTLDGAQIGTPGYMPPEQVRGQTVDGRADVYALGCILFEIVADRPALPRDPTVFQATLASREHRPRRGCPELDIPPELDELCARATAAEPGDRLASPGELAAGLQRFLDGDRDALRRHALATEYAVAAGAALDAGDRATAMRTAGRALALEPDNPHAQELVAGLLLAPAETPPAEVDRELAIESMRAGRVQLRAAAGVCALFLLAMPALSWFGVRQPGWVLALTVGILLNLIGFLYVSMRDRPIGRGWLYAGLVLHCGTLALAGFVLGPLLVVPTLAVGSVAGFLSQPMVSRRLPVIVAHVIAVVGPFVLELAGVVPRTFSIDGAGLRLHPWAVDVPPGVLMIVVLGGAVLQIVATSLLVIQLRRAKDAAEKTTRLQLWHLRQLVPASLAGAPQRRA